MPKVVSFTLLILALERVSAIPFNPRTMSPRSSQADIPCTGGIYDLSWDNFSNLDCYHWMHQFASSENPNLDPKANILDTMSKRFLKSFPTGECLDFPDTGTTCSFGSCDDIKDAVAISFPDTSPEDVARAHQVFAATESFHRCMESIYSTIFTEGMFNTAMSDELILKFVKDKQDTTQVGTKDIVTAAGTMISAGLSVMPFLAGTGVAEIGGGLINAIIGVVGATDQGTDYQAIAEYLGQSVEINGLIVKMVKNGMAFIKDMTLEVSKGGRDKRNWALWDWLEKGKFASNPHCTDDAYQTWIGRGLKASLINAIWKMGGVYVVRIPVDDCANGDKHGADIWICDVDNKWLNVLKQWVKVDLDSSSCNGHPPNTINYHAQDPKGSDQFNNPNQFFSSGMNVNEALVGSLAYWKTSGLKDLSDAGVQDAQTEQWKEFLADMTIQKLTDSGTTQGGIWSLPVCQVTDYEARQYPEYLVGQSSWVPCHCQLSDGSDATNEFKAKLEKGGLDIGAFNADCQTRHNSKKGAWVHASANTLAPQGCKSNLTLT